MATTHEKLSFFLTSPLLSAEEVSYAFLMAVTCFQIILQLLYLGECTLIFAGCHGFLPQILEVSVDWILTNYWLPIEILGQRSQTGYILLPEAFYLVHFICLNKKKKPQQFHFYLCVCPSEKPLNVYTRKHGQGCFLQHVKIEKLETT